MRFNLETSEEHQQARNYLEELISHGYLVDITRKFKTRSASQNNYLHLLLSYVSLHTGEELEYFKQEIWKKLVCPDIFEEHYRNELLDEDRVRIKSSSELDLKEMSKAIERLRNWSSKELGIYLPDAGDHKGLSQIEKEVDNNKQYL